MYRIEHGIHNRTNVRLNNMCVAPTRHHLMFRSLFGHSASHLLLGSKNSLRIQIKLRRRKCSVAETEGSTKI